MKKTNILFVLPNFDTGGSEKLVVDIATKLNRRKFNPLICVFFSGFYETIVSRFSIPLFVIHDQKILTKKQVCLKLNRIIKENSVHVVNSHHSSPLIQGVIPFKILNRLCWIHTEHTRLDLDPHITKKILLYEKICLKFVDGCVGISDGVCEFFKHELRVKPQKVFKIYNGVDDEKYLLSDEEKKQIRTSYRQEFGIQENEVVIGLFANFRKQKNHLCLVKAIGRLKDGGITNFRILFAGDGPERKTVEDEAERRGVKENILFLGSRSDIPELLTAIDIYCLPSFFEGLPLSLIEAAIAKKTLVASHVIGNIDVINEINSGTLFESDNDEELSDILLHYIIDGEKLTSDQCIDIGNNLKMSGMIRKYESLFSITQ
ncbi:MAG: glycosyltransferase [Desulfobulbaceae bacterium]|nr:MAG: glycosyltransferase [Desulfobulbaceae bacterium]